MAVLLFCVVDVLNSQDEQLEPNGGVIFIDEFYDHSF